MKPLTCPNGHVLPRDGCSPIYCGSRTTAPKLQKGRGAGGAEVAEPEKHAEKRRKAARTASPTPSGVQERAKQAALATFKDVGAAEIDEKDEKAASALAKQVAKRAARRNLVAVPEGLEGGDAEEWAQKKVVSLLPDAAAELEYQLKYGDDNQRREAARDVLDANGMRRRDAGGNMTPTIILNLGDAKLPWEKAHEKVVAGEAARGEEGKAPAAGDKPAGSGQAAGGGGQAG